MPEKEVEILSGSLTALLNHQSVKDFGHAFSGNRLGVVDACFGVLWLYSGALVSHDPGGCVIWT